MSLGITAITFAVSRNDKKICERAIFIDEKYIELRMGEIFGMLIDEFEWLLLKKQIFKWYNHEKNK